jgi:DNA polymerase-1
VVARHLWLQLDKTEQASNWSGSLTEGQIRYAAEDVAHLLPLLEVLQQELAAAGLAETFHLECRAFPAVAWLETSGVSIDGDRWRALATEAGQRSQAPGGRSAGLALPLQGLEASPVCWSSPEQVLAVLRERGIDAPSTSEAALAAYLDRDPLIPLLLEHRKVAKLASAYGPSYLEHLHPVTGRLHPDWFHLGSEAGRMSCRSPNLQRIPQTSQHRACVAAPEGRVLVKADYSQIELGIAAEISGDQRLIDTYRQGGDVHALTARQVLGRQQVTGADWQKAKALNFGLLYGMGADRLRRYARAEYGSR